MLQSYNYSSTMNFMGIVRRLTPLRWQHVGEDNPLSMVLLLRQPHFFGKEELRLAAERAWHTSFAGGEGSMHAVAQAGNATLLKAGPHLLNFFFYPKPYIDNPRDNITWLPHVSQQRAWANHSACVGIDYLNHDTDVEMGYCVLAKLVAELVDENCTAVYVPRESSLIPNDASLHLELHKMASIRDSGVVLSGEPRLRGD
jgi:hypothetical protein